MIYRPRQPSATAEVRVWCEVLGRWAAFASQDFMCLAFFQAGWNDVPLSVMALLLDGIPAKDVWPLRAVASRWAHAVRSVTAFELSVQVESHSFRAKLSAIYRCQRNYPLAKFVLRLSETMSLCQAARLLLMVTKMVSVCSMACAQQRIESTQASFLRNWC